MIQAIYQKKIGIADQTQTGGGERMNGTTFYFGNDAPIKSNDWVVVRTFATFTTQTEDIKGQSNYTILIPYLFSLLEEKNISVDNIVGIKEFLFKHQNLIKHLLFLPDTIFENFNAVHSVLKLQYDPEINNDEGFLVCGIETNENVEKSSEKLDKIFEWMIGLNDEETAYLNIDLIFKK